MHVIPQLRKLEQKYERELAIIGVHAGKFLAERETKNIRQAVLRLGIEHPVVNDRQYRTWRAYGVSAWPTLALIDPDGNYVGSHPGEITFESFDPVIGQTVSAFDTLGRIDRSPIAFRREREAEPNRPLEFPQKVLATPDGRLLIADTNHHRVLVVDVSGTGEEGSVKMVIGEGSAGLRDGTFSAARFNRPHGLALDGDKLYVADTDNHAIREVDLIGHEVRTIAGNGEPGVNRRAVGIGPRVALNSPWDLCFQDGTLFIAMAGFHQLWATDLKSGETGPFAGSGLEDIADGRLLKAALAQPSGITCDGRRLHFADAESSSIRWADLGQAQEIHTIVGKGLFDYGDKDGVGTEALLQHAQGIAAYEGRLYIADTYNSKVKVVEPDTARVTTLAGTGEDGLRDGLQAEFDEPGGISAANGKAYVADTNNHSIRVVDINSKLVSTFRLTGI